MLPWENGEDMQILKCAALSLAVQCTLPSPKCWCLLKRVSTHAEQIRAWSEV